MNVYFTYSPLTANTVARAADVNNRFSGVEAGFNLLPPPLYLYEDRITYSVDTGVANAYVATPSIPITAYNEGLRIRLKATHNNSGASTLNVSGLGVKQIVRADGTALQLNDIVAGQILDLNYDGTQFRLSLAFADISPAGVMSKIAAGGNMAVNGSVTATSFISNGQILDGLTAFGVSLAESASAAAARSLLGLGTVVTHDFSEFLTSAALTPYAPLASPTFTGVPAGPTAAPGTNTTQLATTAFVTAAIASGGGSYAPINSPAFTGVPTAPTAATATNTTQVATTAYVQANLGSYAPLASPAFSGTPTAPTAAPGTNTTQIASTAFVTAAVAGGGGGGGAPLDSPAFTGTPTAPTPTTSTNSTRLATTAYVQNNLASYAAEASPNLTGVPTAPTAATATNSTQIATTAYVKANLGSYALLASPALSGTPTAPTAAGGTNNTQIATTAYVQGELGGKANAFLTVTNFTAARTISDNDNGALLRFTGTTARTITMNATPTAGFSCILANRGTVNLTLSAASGEYLNGGGAAVTSITLAPSGKVTLVHEGSGVWTVDGSGAT
jgi:hypothetical protein